MAKLGLEALPTPTTVAKGTGSHDAVATPEVAMWMEEHWGRMCPQEGKAKSDNVETDTIYPVYLKWEPGAWAGATHPLITRISCPGHSQSWVKVA